MTLFDDMFAAYGAPALAEQFGEPVIYKPRGGGSRPITAIRVIRRFPEPLEGLQQNVQIVLEVELYNDATTGISSAELDLGGDALNIATRKGATDEVYGPIDRRISQLLWEAGGVIRVEVR